MNQPVTIVKGDDPVLRDAEVNRVIDQLLGEIDRMYALEDFTLAAKRKSASAGAAGVGGEGENDSSSEADDEETSPETPVFRAIMNALSSPPFMTPMRVIVVRDIGGLGAEQTAMLAGMIVDPLDGVALVLVSGGGRIPAALDKALKAVGAVTVAPKSEKVDDVLDTALKAAKIKLTPPARAAISSRLGEDAGRVPELVALLESTYGSGAQLDVEEVEHYLGATGTVPSYTLMNSIDAGDTPSALETLNRLLEATSSKQLKPMHPLQIMGMLTRHYEGMVRIDSPDVATKEQAAAILGIKDYPAKLRLASAQRLGTRGLSEAFALLAQADLDFRGGIGRGTAVPNDVTIELLVARLSSLAKRHGARPQPAASGGFRRR